MKKLTLAAGALGLALALLSSGLAGEATWLTSHKDALEQAKKENKIVLADFTGSDWCSWCQKLKKEVFDTPEFQEWAAKKAVLLELDYPKKKKLSEEIQKQNKELKEKFEIKGYPTVVFMDADGNKLGQVGYVAGGPKEWLRKAELQLPKKEEKKEGEKGEAGAWLESWDKAVAKAKEQKRLILADFTGSDWCGWCIKLKKEVFEKKEFQDWAAKNVVLLELDFPNKKPQSPEIKEQNQKLSEKYGIQGFPTILFLDAEGNKVGQMGYQPGGPEPWTKKAQEIVDSQKK